VKSATITIAGHVFPATLSLSRGDKYDNMDAWVEKLTIDGGLGKFDDEHDSMVQIYLDVPADPFNLGIKTVCHNYKYYCVRMAKDLDKQRVRYKGSLYCIRMARVRRKDREARGEYVEEVEYSLLVHQPDPLTEKYKRIGMAIQRRTSDKPEDLAEPPRMWLSCPSCFETGGLQRSICIT
jgi:hypothetical protein